MLSAIKTNRVVIHKHIKPTMKKIFFFSLGKINEKRYSTRCVEHARVRRAKFKGKPQREWETATGVWWEPREADYASPHLSVYRSQLIKWKPARFPPSFPWSHRGFLPKKTNSLCSSTSPPPGDRPTRGPRSGFVPARPIRRWTARPGRPCRPARGSASAPRWWAPRRFRFPLGRRSEARGFQVGLGGGGCWGQRRRLWGESFDLSARGWGVWVYGIEGFGGSRRGWGCLDLSAWLLGGMGFGSLGFWWRSFAPHG
jgi:hypothetical protein